MIASYKLTVPSKRLVGLIEPSDFLIGLLESMCLSAWSSDRNFRSAHLRTLSALP